MKNFVLLSNEERWKFFCILFAAWMLIFFGSFSLFGELYGKLSVTSFIYLSLVFFGLAISWVAHRKFQWHVDSVELSKAAKKMRKKELKEIEKFKKEEVDLDIDINAMRKGMLGKIKFLIFCLSVTAFLFATGIFPRVVNPGESPVPMRVFMTVSSLMMIDVFYFALRSIQNDMKKQIPTNDQWDEVFKSLLDNEDR